jgi:hypothetical protein
MHFGVTGQEYRCASECICQASGLSNAEEIMKTFVCELHALAPTKTEKAVFMLRSSCKISGFHSGTDECSSLLGCYTLSSL